MLLLLNGPNQPAYRPIMQPQMPGNFTLHIPVLLNGFSDLHIPFALVARDALRKDLFKRRSCREPLAPRDIGDVLVFLEVIDKLINEVILAQKRLSPNLGPDRLLSDSPLYPVREQQVIVSR